MKKIFTLLLLLGMVCTANATWYVSGVSNVTNSTENWGTRTENVMTQISGTNIFVLVVEDKSIIAWNGGNKNIFSVKFTDGTNWYGDSNNSDDDNNIHLNFQGDGTYTIVYYFNADTHAYRFISTPMLRWNLGNSGSGNWSWGYEESSMFTKDGDYSWTYELTPTTFTSDASFRLYSCLWDKQAYPASDNSSISYGSSEMSSKFEYTTSNNCWKITKPNYTYEKVIITATYKPFDTTNSADWGQWEISADAYISKEISSVGYATFGSNASVDFSKAIPAVEGNSFTARKGKVNTSTGKITYSNPITTLYGGEGALLHGDAGTYSIPVTTSASADATNNDFKAIDTKQQVTQVMSGLNAYILTNKNNILGFYKPADTTGSWCAATTAYLGTTYNIASSAREFFPVWEETPASVDAVLTTKGMENGSFYNLAGQQVAKPTKGLYIVNGKKVVIK